MHAYVARQAIVNTKKDTIAYELLFRDGWNNSFPDILDEAATSKIIADSLLSNGFEAITGEHKAFINFSDNSLVAGHPEALDKKQIVVEILETAKVDEALVAACKKLHKKGYTLALDDFDFEGKWAALYEFVSIIKIDISEFKFEELEKLVATIDQDKFTLLAERVETYKQFEQFRDMGFSLFQGYFFAKPEIIENKKLSPNRMAMMQLLAETAKSPMDFDAVNTLVSRDAALTFKLLKFINSPAFGKVSEIKSLEHALAYLGETELRKFISLIALANMNDDKPAALIGLAAVRARFCEQLVAHKPDNDLKGTSFLTGLLSLISAFLDNSQSKIFANLPVDESILEGLKGGNSESALALRLAVAYEKGQWDKVADLSSRLGVESEAVGGFYEEAVTWADAFAA